MCGNNSIVLILIVLLSDSIIAKEEATTLSPVAGQVDTPFIETASEGKCMPQPIELVNITTKMIADMMPKGGFYHPFNSRYYTYKITEILRGKPVTDAEEVADMYPRFLWGTDNANFTNSSEFEGIITEQLSNQAKFSCKLNNNSLNRMACEYQHIGSSKILAKEEADVYVTMTDGSTYFVSIVCWRNGSKSWTVASTKLALSEDLTIQVLEHVHLMDFDALNSFTIDYSHIHQ